MSSGARTDHPDAKLIKECLQNNEEAWRALVDRYGRLVASIPRRLGIPPEDSADIFQGVFLDLFNELSRLREPGALPAWLIRVTTHKCYRWRRRRQSQGATPDSTVLETLGEDAPVMSELMAALETEQTVRDAITLLPARCREMIELLFFEHPPLSYKEVAKRLRLATGSIGFIRGRCLQRMKEILEQKGF
jgi:RNA polymerase sigma factor (sigma-70 family)